MTATNVKTIEIMKLTEINQEIILSEYENADKNGKELLIRLYGKDIFSKTGLTFEKACEMDNVSPSDIIRFPNPANVYQEGKNAEDMLDQLYKMTIGNWKINWANQKQEKWAPYFEITSAGFVFRHTNYHCTNAYAGLGSRLRFPNSKMAEDFGKEHILLYEKVHNMGLRIN